MDGDLRRDVAIEAERVAEPQRQVPLESPTVRVQPAQEAQGVADVLGRDRRDPPLVGGGDGGRIELVWFEGPHRRREDGCAGGACQTTGYPAVQSARGTEASMKTVTGDRAAEPIAGSGAASTPSMAGWLARILDRIRPFEYPLVVIAAVGLVVAGQLIEDMADSPPIQMLTPAAAPRRWTVIALVLYELVIAGVVSQTVRGSIDSLRRVVKVDRATFDEYERLLQRWHFRADASVLLISGFIVTALFGLLRLELLSDDPVTRVGTHVPTDPISAAIVLAGYAVLAWAGLRLLIIAVRLGRLLGRLRCCPWATSRSRWRSRRPGSSRSCSSGSAGRTAP